MSDPMPRLNAALEGRYRIERELGEGGMATVYLADDLKHERKVAMKVLKPELAAVVGAERFLAEIKTTANLQHPHILPLYDSGEADSLLFYVMPYVEGESLRERLNREHQLPVDDAVRIATNMAEALDYAHREGVIHRDIKPANVLLLDGKPVISDFGIALAVGAAGGGRLTETGLSLGTPHYMSPEQATGDQNVGPATDIYALGCVLYEMLVGEPPFTGSTAQAVLGAIILGDPDRVTAHRRTVPEHVAATVARAVEKVPADRFASAKGMVDALNDMSFDYRTPTQKPSRSAGAPSVPVALFALVFGTIMGWALAQALRQEPDVARSRLTVSVPGGHEMHNGDVPMLAISPDGATMAFVSDGLLQIRRMDSLEALTIEGTENAIGLFFSPDGQWVGFAQGDLLKRVSIDGGPILEIRGATGAAFGGEANWNRWGSITYAPLGGTTGVWQIPEDGGNPVRLTVIEEGSTVVAQHWPQLIGGGKKLLYTAMTATTVSIRILDLDTGAEEMIADGGRYGRFVSSGHVVFLDGRGTVMAVPVDESKGVTKGPAFPTGDQVRVGYWVGGAASLAVADNGTAVFVRGSNYENYVLQWFSRDGEPLGTLGDPLYIAQTRISPDGRTIAGFVANPENEDVWLIDAETGDRDRLTFEPGWDWYPVWSPDGAEVVTKGVRENVGEALQRRPATPGSEAVTVRTSGGEMWADSWSRDGQWLAFTELDPDSLRNIYALRLDSPDSVITIAGTASDEFGARFSPDGSSVVYMVEGEVMVVPFPSISSRVQVSEGGGRRARWSADGTELFYWQGDSVMAVPVGPDGLVGRTSELLFEVDGIERGDPDQGWAVAPDGERFLMRLKNPAAPAREIVVAHGWLDTLVEREPS